MHLVELVTLNPTCASDMCKPYTGKQESTYTACLDHSVYSHTLLQGPIWWGACVMLPGVPFVIPWAFKPYYIKRTFINLYRTHLMMSRCNAAQSSFCICWSFWTIFNYQDIQISSLEPSVTFVADPCYLLHYEEAVICMICTWLSWLDWTLHVQVTCVSHIQVKRNLLIQFVWIT